MKQNLAVELTESGYVPDSLVRHGIRQLLRQRLDEIQCIRHFTNVGGSD